MLNAILGRTKPKPEYLPIALVLMLSSGLNSVGLTWGLPHYLDWAVDSIAPFQVLEAAYQRFSHGWAEFYPPMHYMVLAAFNTPLISYLLLSGGFETPRQVFPFGFTDPLSALTYVTFISRIVSVLMGVAIVFLVYLTVCELFDRRAAFFSALIVTLHYPLIHYAHTANVEVPYLFWSILAIYYFLQVLKQGTLKAYILFALFATVAICTKDQAYGLFLLAPLPVFWRRFIESAQTSSRLSRLRDVILDRRYILAMIVAVATFVLTQNLLFNLSGFIEHVRLITGPGSEPYARYAPTLEGRLQLLWATVLDIVRGFSLPLFGFCVGGAVYCALRFPRDSLPLLFLAASYYLTFINLIRYELLRYILPMSIILSFFGGKILAELWHRGPWRNLSRAAICVAFVYAAVFPIQLDILYLNEARYAAEQWMQDHFREGAIVETFAPYTLHKYYPRFPSWIKVRASKLESGTQWEPRPVDRVRLPNLHTGREAPDYIVLSELWHGRFLQTGQEDTDQARVLRDIFQGRMEYTLVAAFKTPTVVPIVDLPVNPRILIFERSRPETALQGERGSTDSRESAGE